MPGEDQEGQYWRDVFRGAFKNTLQRVGWDPKKIILAVAAFVGSWILSGTVVPAAYAVLIGIAVLAPFIFVWGIIQAQAEMYRAIPQTKTASSPPVLTSNNTETNYLADPKPDFAMWRHRQTLTLLEAPNCGLVYAPALLGEREVE